MKTYADIKAEIAKLEKRAEDARKAEIAGVVGRIKEAISAYGLTAGDLGLGRAASSRAKPVKAAIRSVLCSVDFQVCGIGTGSCAKVPPEKPPGPRSLRDGTIHSAIRTAPSR